MEFCITFTCMHLADACIQSELQCIQVIRFFVSMWAIQHQRNWWAMQVCGRNVIGISNSHKCALLSGRSDYNFHQCNSFLCAICIGSGSDNLIPGGLLSSQPASYFQVALITMIVFD